MELFFDTDPCDLLTELTFQGRVAWDFDKLKKCLLLQCVNHEEEVAGWIWGHWGPNKGILEAHALQIPGRGRILTRKTLALGRLIAYMMGAEGLGVRPPGPAVRAVVRRLGWTEKKDDVGEIWVSSLKDEGKLWDSSLTSSTRQTLLEYRRYQRQRLRQRARQIQRSWPRATDRREQPLEESDAAEPSSDPSIDPVR